MALSLALTTPVVALALVPRVGPLSASLGMLCAFGVVIVRTASMTGMPGAADLFEGALTAAAAAFAAGVLAGLVAPRRGPAPTPGAFDPFADTPGWNG